MTHRPPSLRLAADPADADPGVTVKRAAAIIGCDPTRVYKLVKRGALAGYRDGRSVRIYLSSIEDYRARNAIVPDGAPPATAAPRTRASSAGYREAVAYLKQLGIV